MDTNCGTLPFERVESCDSWRRVLDLFLFPQVLTFIIADQDITHCKQINTSFSFPTFLTFSSISHMTKRQLLQLCLAFSFPQVLTVFNPFQSYYYRPNKQTNKLHSVFQGNCVYQGV